MEDLTASESALPDLSGLVLIFPGTWTGRGISQQVRLSRERVGETPWLASFATPSQLTRWWGIWAWDAGGGDKAPLVTMAAGPSRSVSLGPLS